MTCSLIYCSEESTMALINMHRKFISYSWRAEKLMKDYLYPKHIINECIPHKSIWSDALDLSWLKDMNMQSRKKKQDCDDETHSRRTVVLEWKSTQIWAQSCEKQQGLLRIGPRATIPWLQSEKQVRVCSWSFQLISIQNLVLAFSSATWRHQQSLDQHRDLQNNHVSLKDNKNITFSETVRGSAAWFLV